jgi:hypothetical protein
MSVFREFDVHCFIQNWLIPTLFMMLMNLLYVCPNSFIRFQIDADVHMHWNWCFYVTALTFPGNESVILIDTGYWKVIYFIELLVMTWLHFGSVDLMDIYHRNVMKTITFSSEKQSLIKCLATLYLCVCWYAVICHKTQFYSSIAWYILRNLILDTFLFICTNLTFNIWHLNIIYDKMIYCMVTKS